MLFYFTARRFRKTSMPNPPGFNLDMPYSGNRLTGGEATSIRRHGLAYHVTRSNLPTPRKFSETPSYLYHGRDAEFQLEFLRRRTSEPPMSTVPIQRRVSFTGIAPDHSQFERSAEVMYKHWSDRRLLDSGIISSEF